MMHVTQFLDVIVGLIWFVIFASINIIASEPTQFILVYAITVVVITWKRDLRWGGTCSSRSIFGSGERCDYGRC